MAKLSGNMNKVLKRLTLVLLIVATVMSLWLMLSQLRSETAPFAGWQMIDTAQIVDSPPASSVIGDSRSRFAIVEFSDFECLFCVRHAKEIYPRLAEEYVVTGKVRYVFRHYPLTIHPFAFKAAEAVECAAREGMFWEMHDMLFKADGSLAEMDLLRYATSLGLESTDFETCLKSAAMVSRVMEDIRDGEDLRVTGTPTFFLAEVYGDGKLGLLARLNGAKPYSVFKDTLDELSLED